MTTHQLDPQWIAQIYENDTGQDFLGLRSVSGRITAFLLPGIVTAADRARYYSFFSWLLADYKDKHPKNWSLGEFIKRREQIFALANLACSAKNDATLKVSHLNGTDKLTVHWSKHAHRGSIPITCNNYLDRPRGSYDDFAGAMSGLRIWKDGPELNSVELLGNNRKLARGFTQSIERTRYFKNRHHYDSAIAIPVSVLEEYGEACHLNRIVGRPDQRPLIDVLFAFDLAHQATWDRPDEDNREHMRGSLGLILEMLDQAEGPFGEDEFRRTIAYAGCADYPGYHPSKQLRPYLAHWQMYQLREYFVFALYGFWVFFLKWLAANGPAPLSTLDDVLATFDLKAALKATGLKLKCKSSGNWLLSDWFEGLLSASGTNGGTLAARCNGFARRAATPLNEYDLNLLMAQNDGQDPQALLVLAWLTLSVLYLRLKGLKSQERWNAWYWAENGGLRQRSMAGFVKDMDVLTGSGQTIAGAWQKISRDYVVSQHIVTSLEKWRERQPRANTFHFNYDQGILEWVRFDETALELTASRFGPAANVLYDLGLFEVDKEDIPRLTALGEKTLRRVLETTDE